MNRIRMLREERGWTQAQLGEMLNVKDSAISKYETEKIPLTADTLKRLSEIFDVSVDYILGLSPARKPCGTSHAKPKILEAIASKDTDLLETMESLSDEAKKKAMEYIDMLKTLDEVKSGKNCIDLGKKG